MNNTSSDEVANLMPRSDSGGFRSHKPDSVVAVQNQSDQVPHSQLQTDYIHKRQSMIHSQECIRDMPDIPPDLHDPQDTLNGNAAYSKLPLETMM